MKYTYTLAEMRVPTDVFDVISDVLNEVGQSERITVDMHTDNPTDGRQIDMTGIALVPDSEQDLHLVSSGTLSDHDVGLGEEAFTAGYRAAVEGLDLSEAWAAFTPDLSLYERSTRYNRDAS